VSEYSFNEVRNPGIDELLDLYLDLLLGRTKRRAQILKELVHRFGQQAGQLSTRVLFPAVPLANPVPERKFGGFS
jgi:hypothetical protein